MLIVAEEQGKSARFPFALMPGRVHQSLNPRKRSKAFPELIWHSGRQLVSGGGQTAVYRPDSST